MPDTVGQQDLRGLDIDKLAKGYADQDFVFKNFLTVTPTSAREIRWYRKTSGVPDTTDTSGITASQIPGVAWGALPPIVEQSATRLSTQVRHYAVQSPWMSYADIRDSDLDMLAINVRDLTRAVANQVDYRIFDVLSGSVALSGAAAGTGWDDASNGNPINDLLSGATQIALQNYNISDLVVLLNPRQYQTLLNYLIVTKGSSIPSFSSGLAQNGVLMNVVGQKIVVSPNVTSGIVLQLVPQRTATWKQFTPITANVETKPGIGSQITVWEDGEIFVTDPNAGFMTTGAG